MRLLSPLPLMTVAAINNSHCYQLVLLTLSQFLYQCSFLQQRNKPKEPPKVPKSAPFFLPTVPGVDFKFDVEKGDEETTVGIINTRRLSGVHSVCQEENGQKLDTFTNCSGGSCM